MYMHVKKLAATTLPLFLSVLLSACGGASSDEPSNNQSSLANKPQVSSIEASSIPSSAAPQSSTSNPATTSATTTSANTSSLASNPTDSYARISRVSSSSNNFSSSNFSSNSSMPLIGTDSTPPTATYLMLYQLSENSLRLIWDDATDNVGISHYEIERNGQLIAILQYPTNILSDYQLLAYTDYQYTITAFDTAGNKSERSPVFTVRTLANANSSKSNSSSNSSKSSAKNSSSTSSVSNSASSQKSAKLTWTHPNQRENGEYLELDEIGGYEIRYRKTTDNRFTYIQINSNKTTEYSHANANDTEFEIAVFDTNGVYSRFVKVTQ